MTLLLHLYDLIHFFTASNNLSLSVYILLTLLFLNQYVRINITEYALPLGYGRNATVCWGACE
jgi:hypothetical protein